MTASVSTTLMEAHQEVDLAVLLLHEAAFWCLVAWYCPRHYFLWDAELRFWVWFDALRTCGFVRSELSLCLLLLCSDSVLSLASACSLCEDLHRAVETIVESVSGSLPGTPG